MRPREGRPALVPQHGRQRETRRIPSLMLCSHSRKGLQPPHSRKVKVMRAIRRLCLPLVALAAAAAIAAGPAHPGGAAAHPGRPLASPVCPAGSNWDNVIQGCD